ncbi:hypothetical protein [Crocosphaera sp. XPORK-15E]|uniref:hypothetical protein n=1 Tax=Crocosphaera sp. XPORK-15E TaxID=3110247 RepID=UPI002B201239|nr:hypothetical protein [Crocosphaera sp. XPORK-15E]MEA5534411.1 hypothetical protein [Crocosphaera sp. XPORK-15E]
MSKLLDKFKAATPEKQEFILKDLAKELAKGQQFDRLCQLLTDFNYLQVKLDKLGVAELIEDYDLVQNHESWEQLRLIQKALYMSGHILDKDTNQLAKELTRLLVNYQHLPNINRFLKNTQQYQDQPWLCLLSPTISSPLAQPLIRTLTGHSSSVETLELTPDGKKVISGSRDYTLKVWDLATGNLENTLTGHSSMVYSVTVTPDGKQVISGSRDNTLKIWDLATGNLEKTLTGHSGRVYSVTVTADGKQVISGNGDNTLKIWDLVTGKCIATFTAEADINCVAVAADGVIVAGDSSGNVHFLRLIGG